MTVASEFPPAAAVRGTVPAAPRARRRPVPRALRAVPPRVEQPTWSGTAGAGAVERSALHRRPVERVPATGSRSSVVPRVAGRSRHARSAAERDRRVPAGRPADRDVRLSVAGSSGDPASGPVALLERVAIGSPGHPAWPGRAVPVEDLEPGRGTGREHRPAAPARLRPTGSRTPVPPSRPAGARVVRPAQPRLRLSRRGRAVLVLLWIAAAAVVLTVAINRVQTLTSSTPVPAGAPAQVTVAPGETLWSIAERVAPASDPRVVVAEIRRLNGMGTGELRAGQVLLLRAP